MSDFLGMRPLAITITIQNVKTIIVRLFGNALCPTFGNAPIAIFGKYKLLICNHF